MKFKFPEYDEQKSPGKLSEFKSLFTFDIGPLHRTWGAWECQGSNLMSMNIGAKTGERGNRARPYFCHALVFQRLHGRSPRFKGHSECT